MSFIDVKFIKQLKDMAQDVSQRKCKNRNCFSQKTLLERFNKKIKSKYLELDLMIKNINMKENIQ